MAEYLVTWTIDIDADSPQEAAQKARAVQLRRDSSATVFAVLDKHGEGQKTTMVDLSPEEDSDDYDVDDDECPHGFIDDGRCPCC